MVTAQISAGYLAKIRGTHKIGSGALDTSKLDKILKVPKLPDCSVQLKNGWCQEML